MKRILAIALALVMILSLAACGGSSQPATQDTTAAPQGESAEPTVAETTDPYAGAEVETDAEGEIVEIETPFVDPDTEVKDLVLASAWGINTWNIYNYGQKAGIYVNFLEPLINVDNFGMPYPGLATEWNSDDDKTWTFTLRDDAAWVDYEGNEKAKVTSEDFMNGLEFVLNFWKNDSFQTQVPLATIEGAQDYYNYTAGLSQEEAYALEPSGKFAEMVGIETPDDHTVIYHCINACPYFESLATSTWTFPVAKGQIEACGGIDGYKAIGPFDYWCCGPYLPKTYVEGNSWSIVPNPTYWDKSAKLFDSVTVKQVESNDMSYNLFELGEVNYPMDVSTATINMIRSDPSHPYYNYLAKKADNSVTWGIFFNYAKKNTDNTFDEQWNKAVANENFRQCFYYGLDLYNYYAYQDPIDPEACARGTYTAYGLGKLSDGTDYTMLVNDALELNAEEFYLHYDPEKLAEYKEKAINELTAEGVTFPVHVDIWSKPAQANVELYTIVKETLEDSLGTDFIEVTLNTIVTDKASECYIPGYFSVEIQGSGAEFLDPTYFLNQLRDDLGGNAEVADYWGHITDCKEDSVLDLFKEYTEMLVKADAIAGDRDARLQALAECETFAIEHALMIPTHSRPSREITCVNTYSKVAATYDSLSTRYINWQTSSDMFTADEIAQFRLYNMFHKNKD